MSHHTLTFRPSNGGVRRFAVTGSAPVVTSDWCDNPQIACQSDQSWQAKVWERIEDRGYVCRLEGDGQWSNRGDHGIYIGTGPTAEAALLDAWRKGDEDDDDYRSDPPRTLIAPMRDHDCEAQPPAVE